MYFLIREEFDFHDRVNIMIFINPDSGHVCHNCGGNRQVQNGIYTLGSTWQVRS